MSLILPLEKPALNLRPLLWLLLPLLVLATLFFWLIRREIFERET